jgi:hypothetical protein
MQNLPDKGVSESSHYLLADCTVTGLTGSVHESQGKSGGELDKSRGISHFGRSPLQRDLEKLCGTEAE